MPPISAILASSLPSVSSNLVEAGYAQLSSGIASKPGTKLKLRGDDLLYLPLSKSISR